MKTLFVGGNVINVFTGEIEKTNMLVEDKKIIGVGDYYSEEDADVIKNVSGKYICPGFIDGHIHIESTMLQPYEFAKISVPHGTTTVIADPHEIANVCGTEGIEFMLEASKNIPLSIYIMLPSCVPATNFDESNAELSAKELEDFYSHPRVLGLAEMMNYPGVISDDLKVMEKIKSARRYGLMINGHAPLLSGRGLDRYISTGIRDDHECSFIEEAKEKIRKGQHVMIRQGTAARNLDDLLPLFDEPWSHRCLLVADDKHPSDILEHGHIDEIIRQAVLKGKNPVTGIRMATLWAAEYLGLSEIGAIAPGYVADFLILDDLKSVSVREVYRHGIRVACDGKIDRIKEPQIKEELQTKVRHSFNLNPVTEDDLYIDTNGIKKCRVIRIIKGQIITDELITDINFDENNGIDINRDILKIAVFERHRHTGHKGIGFISGSCIKNGAVAASVAHDSHNLIIIGSNEKDMAIAAEHIRIMGGGYVVVSNGRIIADMPLPIAGLMADEAAEVVIEQNKRLRESICVIGPSIDNDLFMTMSFVSLPVIPHIKITTKGIVDVNKQSIVSLLY